jgi:hypothetical protein
LVLGVPLFPLQISKMPMLYCLLLAYPASLQSRTWLLFASRKDLDARNSNLRQHSEDISSKGITREAASTRNQEQNRQL